MANKTQPTDVPVEEFLAGVEPRRRREEGLALLAMMRDVTGEQGFMYGTSIVGFGTMHYRYATGREGDTVKVGFSPRKARLSLYGLQDSTDAAAHLAHLGKHSLGVGCVYATRLSDLDEAVLRELIRIAYRRGDYDAQAN
ncbi:DUF1801 domain-containing protein [Demequina oxidasica]|uniref:DUF1801 domain-containing protein n=1 Tax=Demequina oxidasica TaxID=676199 RepID=UPI00078325EC|nr:DUF1801 domain-containing protein [Demequina oxidasica]